DAAGEAARRTFEEGGAGDAMPTIDVSPADLAAGIALTALLVRAGLASSNGEARRAIENNAVSVNGKRITDIGARVTAADLTADDVIKLSNGRKKHVLVRAGAGAENWV